MTSPTFEPATFCPSSRITTPYHLITAPYHPSLKISHPTSHPHTTPASRAHKCIHRPSKTTLSKRVSTLTMVEMVGAVHARTSNAWKTDQHALGSHGGWGQTLPVHVNEKGGNFGEYILSRSADSSSHSDLCPHQPNR